jgi:hypothetical protein
MALEDLAILARHASPPGNRLKAKPMTNGKAQRAGAIQK